MSRLPGPARAFVLALGAAACALGAFAPGPAAAEEPFVPGSARNAIEEAVRAGAPERAAAYLDGLVGEGAPRDRRRHVEAAQAAVKLLPWEVAAPRAVRLLSEALRMDPSDADGAWTAAQELRRDLRRRWDAENGERFLQKLIEIYPETPNYRYELGYLLWGAGRREDARAAFELAHRISPSDPAPAYRLAEMAEDDGDAARAIAYYDAILAARPQEVLAHQWKAVLLSGSLGDHAGALRAIEAGVRAAGSAPPGAEREAMLRRFEEERVRVESAMTRRKDLREMRGRTDRILLGVVAAWAALAAAASFLVRRLPPRAAGRGET